MLAVAAAAAAATYPKNLPGCKGWCGGVEIPYPFGMTESCALDTETFLIQCDNTSGLEYPTLGENLNVTDISLENHEISILSYVAEDCYAKNGTQVREDRSSLTVPLFTISNSKNKFTVLGCDSYAYLNGYQNEEEEYSLGCMSKCDNMKKVQEGSCSGVGCCQTQIPQGLKNISVGAYSFNSHETSIRFNNCTYAFIVEERKFNFSPHFLHSFPQEKMPLVLDWAISYDIQNHTCGANTTSHKLDDGSGYYCLCNKGFHGNPYLPEGCQGTYTYIFFLYVFFY